MVTGMDVPVVTAVMASPRRRGNTACLVGAALDEARALGVRTDQVVLAEHVLAPCLAHDACADFENCPQRDDAASILDRVYAADGLILATPVYYENVSAQMKTFIDRNVFRYSHDEWLTARAVGLIAVTAETGIDDTLAALRRYIGLSTKQDLPVFTVGGYADAAGEAAADAKLMAAARKLGADVARAVLETG